MTVTLESFVASLTTVATAKLPNEPPSVPALRTNFASSGEAINL